MSNDHHNQEDPETGCIYGLLLILLSWILIGVMVYAIIHV